MSDLDYLHILTRRYSVSPEALVAVLCPILMPIKSLDKKIIKVPGEAHFRATFTAEITKDNRGVAARGRTGKFVPFLYGTGQPGWREIAKGRIIEVLPNENLVIGEVYVGSKLPELEKAVAQLTVDDFLEIDQYGAAAKMLSGLAEYHLVRNLEAAGFTVTRMPEDMARHLGNYANFDFLVEKGGVQKKVEAKSLWGTDTRFARLIHSTTTRPKGDEADWKEEQRASYYPTSSCKFATQDFFAVSLFLRTGNISDYAFARSIPSDLSPHGLPRTRLFPEHVNQNPICDVGNGSWFSSLDEIWT
ncbi:hypothetical protein [Rhizobium ruizarguesonis]|uniref:hypothetical protein n=1 Tax=Rhizobium ruizarguesonis TaxID=2081791 RepID=UPI00102F9F0D|nr:hypothetical protein [Rhizobium ruizarguesonis]TAY81975.1 hypothetical protein ELH86_24835 [Rhizobium ruizarguesonis]